MKTRRALRSKLGSRTSRRQGTKSRKGDKARPRTLLAKLVAAEKAKG